MQTTSLRVCVHGRYRMMILPRVCPCLPLLLLIKLLLASSIVPTPPETPSRVSVDNISTALSCNCSVTLTDEAQKQLHVKRGHYSLANLQVPTQVLVPSVQECNRNDLPKHPKTQLTFRKPLGMRREDILGLLLDFIPRVCHGRT